MEQPKSTPKKTTTKKPAKKNQIVWKDPVNPKHVRGFMSEESKESFEKWWNDEHRRQDKSTEVIIDLIVNPRESTTEAKQESYKQELKVLYAKKLERVKGPAKIRTFESVLSGWDKFTRPLDVVIAMNELTLYLKENPQEDLPGKQFDDNTELIRALNENTKASNRKTDAIKNQQWKNKCEMLTMSQLQGTPGEDEKPHELKYIKFYEKREDDFYKILDKLKISPLNGKYNIKATIKAEAERLVISIFIYSEENDILRDFSYKVKSTGKTEHRWKLITCNFTYTNEQQKNPKEFDNKKLSDQFEKNTDGENFRCKDYEYLVEEIDI